MNKRANFFFKGLFVLLLCAVWFLGGIGSMLGNIAITYIRTNNVVGVWAFLFANINLIFIIGLLLFLAGWTVLDQ